MELNYENNTYLSLKDNYGKVINQIIFVIAKSGYGKGLLAENLLEEYHKAGYVVINIADPKDEIEMGYAMFKPIEKYHLDHLRIVGKIPKNMDVKLYHPFTFKIPKKSLPKMQIYTFSLKELARKEWGMIAETEWDTDTLKLLLNASQNISNEDGLYGFMHYLQDIVRGKTHNKEIKADPKNFFLQVTSGTSKSIQDIANYLQPFKEDYFLRQHNANTHLNWKNILQDQKHYHVFVTNYLKDPKLKEFTVMTLFNKIIEHKEYATKPIIIFIPEIRYLVPFKPQGYKLFLAKAIKENLSMMRSMGRGMSCLFDTQVWGGVDEDVRNSATTTFIGELGGASDKEKLAKANRYGKETQKKLAQMDTKNSYLIQGKEDIGEIRHWFPSHAHCEPHYNFLELYKKNYPDQLVSYEEIKIEMKKEIKAEEEKYRDKIKKREEQKKTELEKLKKLKEEKSITKEKPKQDERKQNIQEQTILMQGKIFYDKFNDPDKPMGLRAIMREFNLASHNTVKKRMQLWEEYLKKNKEKKEETNTEIENPPQQTEI